MKLILSSNQLTDEAIRLREIEHKLNGIPPYECMHTALDSDHNRLSFILLTCACGCGMITNPCLAHLNEFLGGGWTQCKDNQ
jgi:hypothetical protein